MPVTLQNKSKQIRTFNLPMTLKGDGLKPSVVTRFVMKTNAKGKSARTAQKITVPPVLTLMPGEVREGLPDKILKVPYIARMLAAPRSGLRLLKQASEKKEPEKKPAKTQPKKTAKARRG